MRIDGNLQPFDAIWLDRQARIPDSIIIQGSLVLEGERRRIQPDVYFILVIATDPRSNQRKLRIPITTFMIARDPYLQSCVEDFTEANKGKAFYASLKGLGDFVFADYEQNKRKRI